MSPVPCPLIPITDAALQAACPGWPFSVWQTQHLIRKGRLGCVRVGRRVLVTRDLLERFVAEHTVDAAQKIGG